jgi:DNA-binding MarR family transcriptional regulator
VRRITEVLALRAILAVVQATSPSTQDVARDLSTLFRRVLAAGDLLRALDEVELSIGQFKTLAMLSDTHDELTVKEVADVMSLSLPAASRAVDGLVQRGYVERREDDADRRQKRVRIAPAGEAVMERVAAVRVEVLARWLETLPAADRERLHAAVSPLLEREVPKS